MKRWSIIFILVTFSFMYTAQTIYVSVNKGKSIYKVNITNCTSTLIASYPNDTTMLPIQIAMTPNGKLWGNDYTQIFEIDTISGLRSNPMPLNIYTGSAMVDLDDSTLIVDKNFSLYKISTLTGSVTVLGGFINYLNGDLTWYDYDLYGSIGNTFLKIKLDANNMNVVNTSTITSLNNSNVLLQNYGLATTTFPNEINYIIGNNKNTLLKICPFNCLYLPLCNNLNLEDIADIASKRLSPQSPEPTVCKGDFVGVAPKENKSKLNLVISPNPCKDFVKLNFSEIKTNISVIIYNHLGKELKTFNEVYSKTLNLNISDLKTGIYLLKVSDNSYITFHKLIISEF